MIKNAIKYPFKLIRILFQLIKIHKGINKVVSNKKNNEIPSTAKVTFKFNIGIHTSLLTNWNVPNDFLNMPQMDKRIRKGNDEKLNATIFNNICCSGFIKINNEIPINGINDV
mgnify:CR=1